VVYQNRCICVIGFLQLKWISVPKSAKLFRSATEKHDLTKHLSLSVEAGDRNHVNRISQLK